MTTPARPDGWIVGRPNLVAAFPAHVPMGLPLPTPAQWPPPAVPTSPTEDTTA